MSDLDNFQKEHGEAWNSIVQSPAFGAAMQHLNLQKIADITALTPEDIEAKGKLVLADLVGHLNHENNLVGLSVMKSLRFGEIREGYPDPEAEAISEHERQNGSTKPVLEEVQPTPTLLPKKPRKRK